MKRRFLVALIAVCCFLAALTLVACGDKAFDGDGHTHSYTNYVYNDDATCGKDGTETAKCEYCDKTDTRKSEAHPATGDHRYTDGVCTVCGATQSPSEKVYKTVTLDPDGGVCSDASKQFEVGAVMQGLPTPTRNGYRFLGWYSGSQLYDATCLMPGVDLSLTAKWERVATVYSDDYVSLKPATSGVKNPIHGAFGVDQCVYVEITSDDLKGGVESDNNFTLRTLDGMEYNVKSGYSWIWYYDDNFSVVNGAQRFSLDYGDNLQFVTVNDGSGVTVKTYLVNIYVLHDYYIGLHKTVYDEQPYDRVRVIEGERFSEKTATVQDGDLQFDKRVYRNDNNGQYIQFDYSTPITKNWELYQMYKPVTVNTVLNGGVLADDLKITPYIPYATLPVPEKSGYDFLGWKMNDKYFADVTGYIGAKYISSENAAETLTAVFEEKRYYFGCGTEKIIQSDTVPVVTYTDETMAEILEVIYVPYNTDCRVPELTPKKDKAVFRRWLAYDKGTGSAVPFDFDVKVTEPIALFADMAAYTGTETLLTLNESAIYAKTGTFLAYMPAVGNYVIEVSSRAQHSDMKTFFTVTYGNESAKEYYATANTPAVINLDINASGFVAICITSFRGSYTLSICGAVGSTSGEPLPVEDGSLVAIGTKMKYTAKKLGYVISGFYDGDGLISDNKDHEFTVTAERKEYGVSWQLNPQLECFNYVLSDDYLEISSIKDKTVTEIIVPDDVTNIHGRAFSGCGSVTSITLPFVGADEASSNINNNNDSEQYNVFGWIFGKDSYWGGEQTYQFRGYFYIPISLRSIVITGGNIPIYAFYGCSHLTNITIPNSATNIGEAAFYNCGNITNITIPNSVTNIGKNAFSGCGNLTNMSIPDSVTNIGDNAFARCSNIASMILPNSVTSIGSDAFDGCDKIRQTVNGVTYVDKWVVDCDDTVAEVNLRNNTVGIAARAFIELDELKSVNIPASVMNIGNSAFMCCNGLTKVTIPNSVMSIGSHAFDGCRLLTNVTIPNSVTSIGSDAFRLCDRLVNTISGVHYLNNWVVGCDTTVTSVSLRDDTVGIAAYAFSGCEALKEITIPSGVKYVGSIVFQNNIRLKTVYCGAKDMPSGWDLDWNSYQYFTIVWDCKNKQ